MLSDWPLLISYNTGSVHEKNYTKSNYVQKQEIIYKQIGNIKTYNKYRPSIWKKQRFMFKQFI